MAVEFKRAVDEWVVRSAVDRMRRWWLERLVEHPAPEDVSCKLAASRRAKEEATY